MLFDRFLTQYIKDLIECSDSEYEVTDKDIEDMVTNIEGNEYVWSILDEAVFNELGKYEKE